MCWHAQPTGFECSSGEALDGTGANTDVAVVAPPSSLLAALKLTLPRTGVGCVVADVPGQGFDTVPNVCREGATPEQAHAGTEMDYRATGYSINEYTR